MYSPSMEQHSESVERRSPDHDGRSYGDSPVSSDGDIQRPFTAHSGIGRIGQLQTPTPPRYIHEPPQITPMQTTAISGNPSDETNAPRSPSVCTLTDEQPHPRQLVSDGDPTSSFSTPDSLVISPRTSLPRASKGKPIERFHPNLVGEQHLRDPSRIKRSTPQTTIEKPQEHGRRPSPGAIDLTTKEGVEQLRRLQELEALRVEETPGTGLRDPKSYRSTPHTHVLGYNPKPKNRSRVEPPHAKPLVETISAPYQDARTEDDTQPHESKAAPDRISGRTPSPSQSNTILTPQEILLQDIEEQIRRTTELRNSFSTQPFSPIEDMLEAEYEWQNRRPDKTWSSDDSENPRGYSPSQIELRDRDLGYPIDHESETRYMTHFRPSQPPAAEPVHPRNLQTQLPIPNTLLSIPLDSPLHERRQKIRQEIAPPISASRQLSPADMKRIADESAALERTRQQAADRADRLALRQATAASLRDMEQETAPTAKPRKRAKKTKPDAPTPSTPPPIEVTTHQEQSSRSSTSRTSTPRQITTYFRPDRPSIRSTIASASRQIAPEIQSAVPPEPLDASPPMMSLHIYTPSGGHGSDQVLPDGRFVPRTSQERSIRRRIKPRKQPDQATTKLAAISMTKSPRQQPKLKPVTSIPDSQAKFVDYKMPSLLALGQIQVTIDEGQPMITVEAGRDAMAATNCINETLANSQEFKHVPRHQHTMILELADKTRRKVTQFITILLVVSLPGERKKRLQQISLMIVPDLMYDVLLSAETCVASSLLRRWLELFRVDVQTLKETSEYIIERASIHPLYADNDPHSSDKQSTDISTAAQHRISTDHSRTKTPNSAKPPPQRFGVAPNTMIDTPLTTPGVGSHTERKPRSPNRTQSAPSKRKDKSTLLKSTTTEPRPEQAQAPLS